MREFHTDISYYDYNMYNTAIILFYKYPEATLRLQNLTCCICWALEVGKEGHPYRHIILKL